MDRLEAGIEAGRAGIASKIGGDRPNPRARGGEPVDLEMAARPGCREWPRRRRREGCRAERDARRRRHRRGVGGEFQVAGEVIEIDPAREIGAQRAGGERDVERRRRARPGKMSGGGNGAEARHLAEGRDQSGSRLVQIHPRRDIGPGEREPRGIMPGMVIERGDIERGLGIVESAEPCRALDRERHRLPRDRRRDLETGDLEPREHEADRKRQQAVALRGRGRGCRRGRGFGQSRNADAARRQPGDPQLTRDERGEVEIERRVLDPEPWPMPIIEFEGAEAQPVGEAPGEPGKMHHAAGERRRIALDRMLPGGGIEGNADEHERQHQHQHDGGECHPQPGHETPHGARHQNASPSPT